MARSSSAGSAAVTRPDRLLGGQGHHPGGDVDVSDLDRDALESPAGARTAALLDVASGQVACAGEQPLALEQESGDGVPAQDPGARRRRGHRGPGRRRSRTSPRCARSRTASVRVTPSLAGSTRATWRSVRFRGPRRRAGWSGRRSRRTPGRELATGDALVLEPRRWLGGKCHADLVERRGSRAGRSATIPRDEASSCCSCVPVRATAATARTPASPGRGVERVRGDLAHEDSDLGEPEPLTTVLRRRRQTEQAGLRAGGPAARLDLGGALVEHVARYTDRISSWRSTEHVVAHVDHLRRSNCNLF